MRDFDIYQQLFLWLLAALAAAWLLTLGQTLLEVWGGVTIDANVGGIAGLAVLVLGAGWVWWKARR